MPENIDYDNLKKRGFLRQRQDGFFVLRTRLNSGIYTKDQLDLLSNISKRYARGFVHATTRQGLEIPFIRYENIERVERELKYAGIEFGTSGPRLRTTTACPGNNWCKSGLIDTFKLAKRIEEELGIKCGMDLPHKFKIAVAGCHNSCTRPQASEIGIHGVVDTSSSDRHISYAIYIGGCGGRTHKTAFKLEKLFTEDEVLGIIARVVSYFKQKAKPRQRLAFLIKEAGRENFLKEIL